MKHRQVITQAPIILPVRQNAAAYNLMTRLMSCQMRRQPARLRHTIAVQKNEQIGRRFPNSDIARCPRGNRLPGINQPRPVPRPQQSRLILSHHHNFSNPLGSCLFRNCRNYPINDRRIQAGNDYADL